ncbi:hypothetical protein TNCV_3910031 [Trichonephila clavipes]|nr:hypothetical protein TNCV_3910031 [Trichonephila clavipes]
MLHKYGIRTPSQTRIILRDSTTPPLHHSKNTMQQFSSIPSTKRSKPSPKQTATRLPYSGRCIIDMANTAVATPLTRLPFVLSIDLVHFYIGPKAPMTSEASSGASGL